MEETREMTKLYRPTKGQSWQLLSKENICCSYAHGRWGNLTARWILRTVKALPIEGFHVARLLWILASLLLKTGNFQFSHCLRITPFSTLSIPINLMSVYWVWHRKYVTPTHRLSLPAHPWSVLQALSTGETGAQLPQSQWSENNWTTLQNQSGPLGPSWHSKESKTKSFS